LADIIGRNKLLVFAPLTMIVEIGIISFFPTTNPTLVFFIFSMQILIITSGQW